MHIQGKTFVVTGAGGGIGGEVVKKLLLKGAHVAAVDLRQEGLDALKDSLSSGGDSLSLHALNITDKEAVLAFPKSVIDTHGTVDGIINCAGIIQPFVKVNDLEFDTIERVMNVNFFGTLYMIKAFLPTLLARPEGYVMNVSSMGGFLPVPGQSVYGASKAAVKLLTEGLYAELLETNVHVSIVFPGATNTKITENSHVTTPSLGGTGNKDLSASMLSADAAAAIIIEGLEKNKPQIFTGKDSRLMNRLYRLNPIYATKLIAKQMKSLLQ